MLKLNPAERLKLALWTSYVNLAKIGINRTVIKDREVYVQIGNGKLIPWEVDNGDSLQFLYEQGILGFNY